MNNETDNFWLAFQDTGEAMGYLLYRAAEGKREERGERKQSGKKRRDTAQ